MYELVRTDGIHDEAVSDSLFNSMAGTTKGLYRYAGPDPQGPPDDEKNAEIDHAAESDPNTEWSGSQVVDGISPYDGEPHDEEVKD